MGYNSTFKGLMLYSWYSIFKTLASNIYLQVGSNNSNSD